MRELKRQLIDYAWVIALHELLRTPRIPVEIRRGSVILAGLLTSPLVISALAWWVLTGKRLPGPVGAWFRDPAVVSSQSAIGARSSAGTTEDGIVEGVVTGESASESRAVPRRTAVAMRWSSTVKTRTTS